MTPPGRPAANRRAFDVVVIGGGPSGCVAAVAFAQRGSRVLLLEAAPSASARLAGEWMHPPGADVLAAVGLDSLGRRDYPTGQGFVVFPHDHSPPIRLPYPDGGAGFGVEHHDLVSELRSAAMNTKSLEYVAGARATAVAPGALTYTDRRDGEQTVSVGRVVGADGRASVARRWAGLPPTSSVEVSRMAGIMLEGADLPFEGYGHLLLGGPGPVLVYRVSTDRIRACVDLPLSAPTGASATAFVWDNYHAVFPDGLRPALRVALRERPIAWASNRVARRTCYGRGDVALVGDSVGHMHPLTAVGMTLGLQDAAALSRHASVDAYRRERTARSQVSEWLATALYGVFTRTDAGSLALREAMYRLWREDAEARDSTMRLLTSADFAPAHFGAAFVHVMRLALSEVFGGSGGGGRRPAKASGLVGLARWGGWLAGTVVPPLLH